MDPFTQRMLERARARQEKIDQKLASSGQTVPKRKPLSENIGIIKSESPVKSPSKAVTKNTVSSPRRSSVKPESPAKTVNRTSMKSETPAKIGTRRPSFQKEQTVVPSPHKNRNDVVVTKTEFKSSRGSGSRRNSDVSLEINIMHSKDIQVDVQIEERDAPMSVTYDCNNGGSNVIIQEIEEPSTRMALENATAEIENKSERIGLRTNVKSRLDRLGNLYSDKPTLSSPIHRTEQEFSAATPPRHDTKQTHQPKPEGKKKFGRFAALADQINNWEDDLTHHNFHPEPTKKPAKSWKHDKLESSTLDVSIHSISDINKALHTTTKAAQPKHNAHTFTKPGTNECQRLQKEIVAELEGEGFRRVSASKSRLVYDFTATENADHARQEPTPATPSAERAPDMATMVASAPNPVTKKPSIKKYRAPTPPNKHNDEDKDKENNLIQNDANDNDASDCLQTKPEPPQKPVIEKGSPFNKKLVSKLNGNVDRSSVLSKAAMFEAGSPKAKDPAEMSLRERKALFEKNKGAAIVPKAPFGMAPSAKTLHGDNKDVRSVKSHTSAKTTPTKSNNSSTVNSRTNSKDNLDDDNVSQTSVGGGIRGKLAALFNKEQTISETTIANKFKQEREKEMEMLQNRFHFKPNNDKQNNDSDDDGDHDPSENAPLMGSAQNLAAANKKPEIIANVPKVTFDDKREEPTVREVEKEKVTSQPVKRRSSQSQDSPVVLSVLEDVKRIKVNNNKKEVQNGTITQQPTLYPHLSDIETDTSHTQDEYSDCGGSSTDEKEQYNAKENLNKSDNWADTSFGREVMNVVKKNNTSYQKAVRESMTDSSEGNCESDLDDMLDEALNEGPTPPKVNKQGSISSSTSFEYQERTKFKSPQKPPALGTPRVDRGSELVHSVSFYRRMQSASSTPTTPIRVVRHTSPEREPTPAEEPAPVTTVRQRIRELQQEVAKQQTVISQASQALNLCAATIEFSGSTEQAEGERLLLLATHRRQACLHEVQRLQVEGAGPAGKAGMATLHIHSITVPLRRDYMRHLNADGATGHYAVCLLKCRDRVLATGMQLTKPAAPALTFPDEVRMDGLASDFNVTVEVYLLPASKEIFPHDVKYHITNKKSSSKLLTPKSKVSELKTPRTQSPGGPLAARSPTFQLHGYCIFALPQATRRTFTLNKSKSEMLELKIPRTQSPGRPLAARSPTFQLHGYCIFALPQATRRTFTLNKLPAGSPLEGTVSIDIRARLVVAPPSGHAAFLTAFDDVSGLGAWHRRWCRLQPPRLAYWKYPDDAAKKPPIGDIDLTTVISEKVIKAPRDICARPNTLLLECEAPYGLEVPESSLVCFKRADGKIVRRHLLAADTPEQRDKWLQCLNSALEYYRCTPADDQ